MVSLALAAFSLTACGGSADAGSDASPDDASDADAVDAAAQVECFSDVAGTQAMSYAPDCCSVTFTLVSDPCGARVDWLDGLTLTLLRPKAGYRGSDPFRLRGCGTADP